MEKNKQFVQSFIKDVLDEHDISAADRYFEQDQAQSFTDIPKNQTIQDFKQNIGGFFQRFPDSRTKIDHIVAENDKVFAMLTTTATEKKTGKRVTIRSADLYRIENAKIAEHWDVVDASEMTDNG